MSEFGVCSRSGKLIVAVALLSFCLVSSQLFAQVLATGGSATGWVVADPLTELNAIVDGEHSLMLNLGPGSLDVPNTNNEPGGSVFAQADFPDLRLKVDSTQTAGKVVYGAAYFEDALTVTGGSGSFEMNVRWTFNGGIQGAGGAFAIGTPPPARRTDDRIGGRKCSDFSQQFWGKHAGPQRPGCSQKTCLGKRFWFGDSGV